MFPQFKTLLTLCGSRKIHSCVRKSSPLDSVPNHSYSIHAFLYHSFEINFNTVLPSTFLSFKWSIPSSFPTNLLSYAFFSRTTFPTLQFIIFCTVVKYSETVVMWLIISVRINSSPPTEHSKHCLMRLLLVGEPANGSLSLIISFHFHEKKIDFFKIFI